MDGQKEKLDELESHEDEWRKEITKLQKQQVKMTSKVESVQESQEAFQQLQAGKKLRF